MFLFNYTTRKTALLGVILFSINVLKAQTGLTDIPEAFKAIISEPALIHLKNKTLKIPSGGHLQGIQSPNGSNLVITASSSSYSYYITAQLNLETSNGQINSVQKIADSPLKHAGGCQLNDGMLLVGIEDNDAKNKSDILLISFNDSLQELSKHVIGHRQGKVKRSTAGAAGFVKTKPNEYMIAVGDWDSRNIDFYFYRTGSDGLADSITTFHAPENQKWCSYQSINLLKDALGNIYLIGFGLDGSHNRADLFKVVLSHTGATLKLINSRIFNCRGGAGFRYAAGIKTNDKTLSIYSCGRNIGKSLPLNVFSTKP